MAGEKGVVLDTDAPPLPVEPEEIKAVMVLSEVIAPSSEPLPPIIETATCSHCADILTRVTIDDFERHVATCSTRSIASDSDSSSGVISYAHDSTSVDRLAGISAHVDDKYANQILGLHGDHGTTDAGHQVAADELVNEKLLFKQELDEFENISAYITDQYTVYDSEEEDVPDVSAVPSDAEDHRISPAPNGKSSAQESQSSKSRALSGTQTPEEYEDFQSHQKLDIPTSHPQDLDTSLEKVPTNCSEISKDLDAISKTLEVSQALSSAVSSEHPTPEIKPATRKTGLRFKKLVPIETFEELLVNPADMPYEQLYHRTQLAAKALLELQTEYDICEKQTADFESAKKYTAKIAADAKKEEDEKAAAATDAELLRLHALYREELKMSFRDFNTWVTREEKKSNRNVVPASHWEFMRQIKNPEVMGKVNKRRRAAEKEAAKPVILLEDTPLPALRRGDEDVRRKRNLFQDPVVFEDRKTADIYMADYSKHRDAIGYQVFKDRRAIVITEDKDENSRPKRSRGKRAYDTEQTSTPGGSEDEETPLGKRRRTVRVVQDLPTSPARRNKTATREGSPHIATFKSGKRIGRPPKSKGEAATASPKPKKSKLQQSHLPPVSEPAESEESDDELASEHQDIKESDGEDQVKKLHEKLESLQQKQHEQPANGEEEADGKSRLSSDEQRKPTSLVEPPSRKRGARGVERSRAGLSGRGGRSGRSNEAVAQESHGQLDDENEIIQSTEQDDESRSDSSAGSRPSSSSSALTAAHDEGAANFQPITTTTKVTAGKRKRAAVAKNVPAPVKPAVPVGESPAVKSPAAKSPVTTRRKTGKKQEVKSGDNEDHLVTPEPSGETNREGSVTASGRPKRRKAAAATGSTYAALPDDQGEAGQEDENISPRPKRRKGGKARVAKKNKAAKGGEATESEYFSDPVYDAGEGVAEVLPKKRAVRAAKKIFTAEPEDSEGLEGEEEEWEVEGAMGPAPKRPTSKAKGKGKAQEPPHYSVSGEFSSTNVTDNPTHAYDDFDVPSGTQTPYDTESPSAPAKRPRKAPVKKQKGSTRQYDSTPDNGLEHSGHEGDGEDNTPGNTPDSSVSEEQRKKLQKSRKLAEATRLRWASGLMQGPMEKRAATNAAKKAAKTAAAIAAQGQGSGSQFDAPHLGGVPASAFTPNPHFNLPYQTQARPVPAMQYPNQIYGPPSYSYPSPYGIPPGGPAPLPVTGPGPFAPYTGPYIPVQFPPPSFSHAHPAQHPALPQAQSGNAQSQHAFQGPAPPMYLPSQQQPPILPSVHAAQQHPQQPVPEAPARPAKKRRSTTTNSASSSSTQPAPAQQAQAASPTGIILDQLSYTSGVPAPTRNSTRIRKPTRLALGQDGASDSHPPSHEAQAPFRTEKMSEYERYQALTSPHGQYMLGKRKRKSLMDLSGLNDDEDDDF
ncbi:hypothetical protein B2J93_6337 [Marssonina coronariae]|uniref:Uncharacterized protein n=1 Tax=Diplocarpon coronariae TaxID=2795749 RepID=A0A218YU18_9HELO|nr:hypothetical protein B2J93_6337 [Marssonina coronariae]